MANNTPVNLVSSDGKRSWTTTDLTEATNLRARGWRDAPAPKPAETKTNK